MLLPMVIDGDPHAISDLAVLAIIWLAFSYFCREP
jgi:hypothetical protein